MLNQVPLPDDQAFEPIQARHLKLEQTEILLLNDVLPVLAD